MSKQVAILRKCLFVIHSKYDDLSEGSIRKLVFDAIHDFRHHCAAAGLAPMIARHPTAGVADCRSTGHTALAAAIAGSRCCACRSSRSIRSMGSRIRTTKHT